MTRSEVMARIKEITEKGMTYAREHAEEIEKAREEDKAKTDAKIAQILLDAKTAPKHSWSTYESFKSQIASVGASSTQYEDSIRKLTLILDI